MYNRRYRDHVTQKEKSLRHERFRKQRRKEIRLICENRRYTSGARWSKTEYDICLSLDPFLSFSSCLDDHPAENAYPKRCWRGKRSKQIKRDCHRSYRRYSTDGIKKSNHLHKATEFWWEYD